MNLFEGRLQEESGKYFITFGGQIKLAAEHIKNELRENWYMLGLQTHTFHFEQNHQSLIPMTFYLSLADVTPAGTILHMEYNGTPMSAYFQSPKDIKRGSITLYVRPEDFFIFGKESGKLLMKYRGA